ncbi:putative ferric-chelate reductase 1 homolog isoform X2 [Mizuhopecten yessoensis]|uniref:Ferric-chelate reductase 1 n=1 Tax=Mizuhopecten yessoensis TaxID=6573 RepID=A0A210QC97_MIZYE|nr:putative ferric-chelate reductase 1 homolog isoform X2 [Mizuhopecten yessoensis]OWF46377.1 Ferric-chelate reductase 1 [Mizuhopecten yessoensis]
MLRQLLLLISCQTLIHTHGDAAIPKDPECGLTKGCFSGCIGGCYETTWKEVGDSIEFTLKAEVTTEGFIAIGFSDDNKMGSDSAIGCVNTGGSVQVLNSFNAAGAKFNQPIPNNKLGLSSESGSVANGLFTCSFTRKTLSTDNQIYSLNNDYYILLAKGPVSGTALGRHDLTNLPLVSAQMADFQSTTDLTGTAVNIMVKLHGCLMIFAWIFLASIGIVLARFYKPVWSDKKMLGEAYWFQLHRSLMILATLAVIAGIVVIFVDVGKWSQLIGQTDWKRAHPYIGVVVGGVVLLNPLMALFRPHPEDKYRYIFSWAHWAVGTLGHLLAVLNIFIGVELPAAKAPSWLIIVLAVYAGYQILFEIFLEIYDNCCTGGAKKKSEMYELHEKSTLGQPQQQSTDSGKDQGMKKVFLAVHALVILGFAATLIIVVIIS